MKKLVMLSLATVGLVAAGIAFVPNIVNAQHGTFAARGNIGTGYNYSQNLTNKAQVLGLSVDELKTQLQTKTLLQIIEEKGMTLEQFRAEMTKLAEVRWADRGLSAEEIAERQARRAEHQAECDGTGGGRHGINR